LTSRDAEGDVASTAAASVATGEGNNRETSDPEQQSDGGGGGGGIGVRQSDILLDSLNSIFGPKKKKKAKKVDIGASTTGGEHQTAARVPVAVDKNEDPLEEVKMEEMAAAGRSTEQGNEEMKYFICVYCLYMKLTIWFPFRFQ